MSSVEERTQLQASMAALEAQRSILGDALVETLLASMRQELAALETRLQPEQVRKQATVLFADVSGFTTFAETMDAEELALSLIHI